MYTRERAAQMGGIAPAAALPTGLIMFDMKCFDILKHPYFYYEYKDSTESEKASTEDVTLTRDMALLHQMKLGYSPIFCNWDAWAGHMKPKCVDKPRIITVETIGKKYVDAIQSGQRGDEKLVEVNAPFNRLNVTDANGKLVKLDA
jgi:hypothetical protein